MYPDKDNICPKMLEVEDKQITNSLEIANVLNAHFTSVGTKYIPNMRRSLDQVTCTVISEFVNDRIPDKSITFSIKSITSDFVIKQLEAMSNSKATGLDGLSVNILKLTAPATAASITYICNLSIRTGQFPSQWKLARVIPLFKTGHKTNCSNYRPISILPVLSKIFEKYVCVCLYEFFKATNYLMHHSLALG